MKHLLFLDAKTKHKNFRLTTFAETTEELMRGYQDWIKEMGFTQRDIWYANIFEVGADKHLGYLVISDEGDIISVPVKNSKVNPYRRNLKQLIDRFIRIK